MKHSCSSTGDIFHSTDSPGHSLLPKIVKNFDSTLEQEMKLDVLGQRGYPEL